MDRVLYVIADLVPFGPGDQAALIASNLRDRFDIDFFCCSRRDSNAWQADLGDRCCAYELGRRNWLGAARKLGLMLRRNKYALMHTWDRRSTILTKWALLASSVTSHRAMWVQQAQVEASTGPKSTSNSIPGIRSPDWVLGDRWLLESGKTKEKSTAIPIAVPSSMEKTTPPRSAMQSTSTVKTIGTICPLEAWTGLKHLIWSLDQIKCVRDDLRLIVWGVGSQASQLRRYARQIGLLDWIQWRSPRRDVRLELADLDMYWHAPRTEGTSPELVAALLSGLPAIAPRTAASMELAATWSSSLVTVPWGARDEIARQTQQWLLNGFNPTPQPVVLEWTRSHAPARVAQEYALAYERILRR